MTDASQVYISQRALQAAGQPISQLMGMALTNPNIISLAAGFVDNQSLPTEITRDAATKVLADSNGSKVALQYGSNHGDSELRSEILRQSIAMNQAAADEPVIYNTELDQVFITPGSNQLLFLLADTILNPGDIVLCASPSYFVFIGAVKNIGGQTYGIATDEQGIIPESLETALKQLDAEGKLSKVKAIYTVPYFDNPGGTTLPAERGKKILDIAKRWSRQQKIYVISDEAYRMLRYQGDDTPSIHHWDPELEHTIVAGTFSKSFSPGIRIGWGFIPRELTGPLGDQKSNIDFGAPLLAQRIMATVLNDDLWLGHVEKIRAVYRERRDAILDALSKHLANVEGCHWHKANGGLCIWLTLPKHIDTGMNGNFLKRAVEAGVLYVPGEYCFASLGEPANHSTIRLTFGVQSAERIEEGVRILSEQIKAQQSGVYS
ncbi:MAG: PLP-dependent aminotransferase family protein [Planctomycetota bacterium]|nr:PLP-dependent aminotransferase family protein [Planctomycetota bacterium]